MRGCLLIAWPVDADLQRRIIAGEHPNMEVFDLARKLTAEIIDYNAATQSTSALVRLASLFNKPLGVALLAWHRRRDFDLFYIGSEKIGILVAALFKFVRPRPRIAMLNHHLSNPKKAFLFKYLRLQSSADALICLNEYQATFLEETLAVSPQKVFRVHYGAMVDGSFFRPRMQSGQNEKYVLSVGRENRDYITLLEALRDSGIRAKLVSSGMRDPQYYRDRVPDARMHDVEMFDHISYSELRNLYAGCSFVVIPIRNVDYPAGMTAIMEAMAMGKPVIATYSRGIEEFIQESVTGFWSEPSNPTALREKMLFLWNKPQLAIAMGERARESVRSRVDMTRFVAELESILTGLH